MKKDTAYYFTVIVIINSIGILLRYPGLDTYIIIIGFRFQLSLLLPALFISGKFSKDFITETFRNPSYKKHLLFIYLLIIPLLILVVLLFILGKIELREPEYFYEFGISSIIDFPVYLAWNSIQLISFFLFFIYLFSKRRLSLKFIFIAFILLFVYELIPLKNKSFDYIDLVSVILFGVITGIMVKYYQNIYWIVVFSFSVFWLNFLLFGTNSKMAVNLLFASQYNSWEGFLSAQKDIKAFILPAQLLLVNILLVISSFNKKPGYKVTYINSGN